MAESTAISIKKFDGTDYKSWSLEIEILLEQKQVLGIVDSTEKAPDAKDETEFKAWKKPHGIVRSTILLAMERSLQQQYGVQKDAKALWDQLKEDYKSKVKLNVWALRDKMSAVKSSNCENVQEYASKIQCYVNDFNLCAESSTGTMPKSEHSYYLMQGIPKNDDWRFFTQLMYDKIDTLADKQEEIVSKMKADEARLQKDNDSEVAAMFSKLRTKNEQRNSKHSRKSQKSRGSGSESDGGSSESEKHRRRHTQECYRCHKVGHIARYCPGTAPVESRAPTETVAAAVATMMATTSIENYWMTVTNGLSPSKKSWYLDYATTTHICGDRQKFEQYTEYTKREKREIRDFAGRVAGKAIGHGDVRLRLRIPGSRHHIHEVVVRNVLHVEGAHNLLSQSRLMDRGLRIVPVNGYGIKIYDKSLAEDSARGRGRGRGSLVGVALQVGGLFRLDVKVAGKLHRSRESRRHTAPNAADEHFYREFLVPEEPEKEISSERIGAPGIVWLFGRSSRHGW